MMKCGGRCTVWFNGLISKRLLFLFFELHAVSSTQQSRWKEPRVKTLRSPLSDEFCSLKLNAALRFDTRA